MVLIITTTLEPNCLQKNLKDCLNNNNNNNNNNNKNIQMKFMSSVKVYRKLTIIFC